MVPPRGAWDIFTKVKAVLLPYGLRPADPKLTEPPQRPSLYATGGKLAGAPKHDLGLWSA